MNWAKYVTHQHSDRDREQLGTCDKFAHSFNGDSKDSEVKDACTCDPETPAECVGLQSKDFAGLALNVTQPATLAANAGQVYTYEIKFGDRIQQRVKGGRDYKLGNHVSYEKMGETFSHGENSDCGHGIQRSATVTYQFGSKMKLVRVNETSTCKYELIVQIPESKCKEAAENGRIKKASADKAKANKSKAEPLVYKYNGICMDTTGEFYPFWPVPGVTTESDCASICGSAAGTSGCRGVSWSDQGSWKACYVHADDGMTGADGSEKVQSHLPAQVGTGPVAKGSDSMHNAFGCYVPEAAAKCSTKFELFGGTTSSLTQCADKETLSSGDCKTDPCTDADDKASCCVTPVAATTTAAPTTAAPTTAATAKTASSTNKASLGGTVMFALVALAAYKN